MAQLRSVEFATLEWVDWFNNRRLLEPIGNIPPAEAEERYYAMLDAPAMVHNLNEMASGKPGAVQSFGTGNGSVDIVVVDGGLRARL